MFEILLSKTKSVYFILSTATIPIFIASSDLPRSFEISNFESYLKSSIKILLISLDAKDTLLNLSFAK